MIFGQRNSVSASRPFVGADTMRAGLDVRRGRAAAPRGPCDGTARR